MECEARLRQRQDARFAKREEAGMGEKKQKDGCGGIRLPAFVVATGLRPLSKLSTKVLSKVAPDLVVENLFARRDSANKFSTTRSGTKGQET